MKFSIVCTAIGIDVDYYQEFLESLGDDNDTSELAILDALKKHIFESDRDLLLELLFELYPDGDVNGDLDLDAVYRTFILKTETNIRNRYAGANMQVFAIDNDGTPKCVSSINIADMLLKLLEEESSCGEFDANVGAYVESCLMQFEASSCWHYGYISGDDGEADKTPSLWYGPDNVPPIDKWVIKYGKTIPEHWFENDWELLNHLVNGCSEGFSIWYTAECGYWLPNMDVILSECPISFSKTDNLEDINNKFKAFFKENTASANNEGYFKGCAAASAFQLGQTWLYETPKTLEEIGVKSAPQSFIYLNTDSDKG